MPRSLEAIFRDRGRYTQYSRSRGPGYLVPAAVAAGSMVYNAVSRSRSRGRAPTRNSSMSISRSRSTNSNVSYPGRSRGAFGSGPRMVIRNGRAIVSSASRTSNSRSGGFFRRNTRPGFRRYQTRYVASRKGVIGTFETGGIINDNQSVYIGHNTCPPNRLQFMILQALVKSLFNKLGVYPTSTGLALTNTISGDTFRIAYRANSDAGTGESYFDYVFVGATTPDTIVANIINLTAWKNATNTVEFLRAEYFPDAANTDLPYCKLILTNAKLVIASKSSLKIQNRTVNETDEENRNEVDNVPLYGKSYYGTGNGAQYVNQNMAVVPFITHRLHGVLAKPSSDASLDEPPLPQHFTNVSKASKVKLEPGQIKTSVLVTKVTLPFFKMAFSIFGDVSSGTVIYKKTNLGKFVFYGLERMIHAASEAPDIYCAYEHNLEMTCHLIGGYPPATARIFEQNFI